MLKQTLTAIKISALALVLSFGLSYVYAWTTPGANPPAGNVDAPINVGPDLQSKAGPITVTGLTTGTLKVSTGAGAAKVLTSDASGNATWQAAAGGSDNLGNHTATQALNMGGFGILGANTVVASDVYSSTGGFWVSQSTPHGAQIFKSSGTWVAPAGVTKVYLSGSGGGGNGGSSGYSYGYAPKYSGGVGAVGYGAGSNGAAGQGGTNAGPGGAGGVGPGYSRASAGGGASGNGLPGAGGGGGLGQSVFKREAVVNPGQSYPVTIGAGIATTFGGVFSIAKGGNGGDGALSVPGAPGANGTQELPIFGASGGGGGGTGYLYGGAGGAGAPGYLIVEW